MNNAIVITNVDSLLGYAIAYRFLKDWNREEQEQRETTNEFRLLCHERQGLEDLERLGGKIYEIENFTDKLIMNHIMKGVYYLMYIPEYSERRLTEGEAVLTAAKDQHVDYVAMFSYVGLNHFDKHNDVDNNKFNKFKNLKQFYQLEKMIENYFDKDNYCIFRSTIWNQFFYYFGPKIEDENKITLPIYKDTKFGSIDLVDLLDAVYNLSTDCTNLIKQKKKKKNQTLFEFTPCYNITAKQLIEYASKGLDSNLKYEKMEPNELYNYLHHIHNDNRFRSRPIEHDERRYTFPLGQYLNDNHIKTLVEYWELIDLLNMDYITDHLEKALPDHKLQDIYHFFKKNKDIFRRLR